MCECVCWSETGQLLQFWVPPLWGSAYIWAIVPGLPPGANQNAAPSGLMLGHIGQVLNPRLYFRAGLRRAQRPDRHKGPGDTKGTKNLRARRPCIPRGTHFLEMVQLVAFCSPQAGQRVSFTLAVV